MELFCFLPPQTFLTWRSAMIWFIRTAYLFVTKCTVGLSCTAIIRTPPPCLHSVAVVRSCATRQRRRQCACASKFAGLGTCSVTSRGRACGPQPLPPCGSPRRAALEHAAGNVAAQSQPTAHPELTHALRFHLSVTTTVTCNVLSQSFKGNKQQSREGALL